MVLLSVGSIYTAFGGTDQDSGVTENRISSRLGKYSQSVRSPSDSTVHLSNAANKLVSGNDFAADLVFSFLLCLQFL